MPTQATEGLYYDTALNPAPSAMRSIIEISDVDHIVFGSDWPFTQLLFMRSGDPQPELSLTFPEQQRHVLERGNALAQLRLDGAQVTSAHVMFRCAAECSLYVGPHPFHQKSASVSRTSVLFGLPKSLNTLKWWRSGTKSGP